MGNPQRDDNTVVVKAAAAVAADGTTTNHNPPEDVTINTNLLGEEHNFFSNVLDYAISNLIGCFDFPHNHCSSYSLPSSFGTNSMNAIASHGGGVGEVVVRRTNEQKKEKSTQNEMDDSFHDFIRSTIGLRGGGGDVEDEEEEHDHYLASTFWGGHPALALQNGLLCDCHAAATTVFPPEDRMDESICIVRRRSGDSNGSARELPSIADTTIIDDDDDDGDDVQEELQEPTPFDEVEQFSSQVPSTMKNTNIASKALLKEAEKETGGSKDVILTYRLPPPAPPLPQESKNEDMLESMKKQEKKTNVVTFGTVQVREYERIIDTTMYLGLALGWAYKENPSTSLITKKDNIVLTSTGKVVLAVPNQTSTTASHRRRSSASSTNRGGGEESKAKREKPHERYSLLLAYGYTRKELKRASLEVSKTLKKLQLQEKQLQKQQDVINTIPSKQKPSRVGGGGWFRRNKSTSETITTSSSSSSL